MLKVTDLDVWYGKIQALKNVSLSVNPSELVTSSGQRRW
jgi:ABC-type branched-subunit amino acid transport system ATPase component